MQTRTMVLRCSHFEMSSFTTDYSHESLGFLCLLLQRKHLAYDLRNKKHPYKLKSSNHVIHCLLVLPTTLKEGMRFPSVQTETRITAPRCSQIKMNAHYRSLYFVFESKKVSSLEISIFWEKIKCWTQRRYNHISHKTMQYYGQG